MLCSTFRHSFAGLWGLRSKMLWVCLDLLFVAFWSSALSLASNDYIASILECGPDNDWWLGYDPPSVSSNPLNVPVSTVDMVCARQAGCIGLSVVVLMLYGMVMVLSLFRIFETVRRTANVGKALEV